jgi:hypothetical protein
MSSQSVRQASPGLSVRREGPRARRRRGPGARRRIEASEGMEKVVVHPLDALDEKRIRAEVTSVRSSPATRARPL